MKLLNKISILSCCFVPLPLVFFFGIFNNNNIEDNKTKRSIYQRGIPLHWLSDNEIVIYKNKGIYKHNLLSKSEQNIFQFQFTEPNIGMYDSCFSDKYLSIKYLIENKTKPGKTIADRTKILVLHLNTLKGESYDKFKNNHKDILKLDVDCRPYYLNNTFELIKLETASSKSKYKYVTTDRKFDLEAKYYQAENSFSPIVQNLIKRMNLRIDNNISSIYDSTSKIYLWYEANPSFDIGQMSNRSWPLKAWWVNIAKNLINEISIPTGPWMKEFSFFERMSSNDPLSQSKFHLYTMNKHIYAHIQDTSVSEKKKDVYHLNHDQKGGYYWHQVVSGEIDNVPVLSKDGCKVIYSKSENFNIVNVC